MSYLEEHNLTELSTEIEMVYGEQQRIDLAPLSSPLPLTPQIDNESFNMSSTSGHDQDMESADVFQKSPNLESAEVFQKLPSIEEANLFRTPPTLKPAKVFKKSPSLDLNKVFPKSPNLESAGVPNRSPSLDTTISVKPSPAATKVTKATKATRIPRMMHVDEYERCYDSLYSDDSFGRRSCTPIPTFDLDYSPPRSSKPPSATITLKEYAEAQGIKVTEEIPFDDISESASEDSQQSSASEKLAVALTCQESQTSESEDDQSIVQPLLVAAYTCQVCSKTTFSVEPPNSKVDYSITVRPMQCTVCKMKRPTAKHMIVDSRIGRKLIACEKCSSAFMSREEFDQHRCARQNPE